MTEEQKSIVKAKEQGLDKIVNKLFATKTPAKFVKTRPGASGKVFKYVEIGYVINELNKAFGVFWEFRVVDKQVGKKQIWVQGQLTIKDPRTGFEVTKETFGGADIKINNKTNGPVDIANDLKAAVSDCTKKCASMFGIAADVFFKEQDMYDQLPNEIDVEEGIDESTKRIVMNKLFAVAAERGFTSEFTKQRAKEITKVAHMENLTVEQLEKLIASIEKNYEVVAPGESPKKVGSEEKPKDLSKDEEDDGDKGGESETIEDGEIIDDIPEDLGESKKTEDKEAKKIMTTADCKQCGTNYEIADSSCVNEINKPYYCSQECQDIYYGDNKPKRDKDNWQFSRR